MSRRRRFNKEIRVMVYSELSEKVKIIAGAKGKTVSEYVREALTNYTDLEYMQKLESKIQGYVTNAVEEKLKPVENRLAKINAKTAHATAISIFLLAQTLADLGKRDVIQVFKVARRKGIEFVRTNVPNTAELEELIRLAEKAKEVGGED